MSPVGKPAFGQQPAIWNVPARNPHFVGRAEVLSELRRRLRLGEPTLVVQALHGLGGVGKTQLAIEYAHRFAADYELVWWLDAEQSVLLAGQLAALVGPLGLPTGDTLGRGDEIAAAVLWLCSPAASFVLGVALPVDGGYTAR